MNAKITFPELVKLMAASTSNSQRMCELFLRELFATVSQALINGETVKIKGIGTFKVAAAKPRKGTDNAAGAESSVPGKLTFTPEKALAEAINQPFAQFEPVVLADEMTDERLAEVDQQFAASHQPEPEAAPEPQPEPADMTVAPLPDDLPPLDEAAPFPEAADIPLEPEAMPVQAPREADPPKAPAEPAKAVSIDPAAPAATAEPAKEPESEPQRRPMLVGRPIDGPSQPVPGEDKVEDTQPDRRFYRPEPRNVYTPTPEQIEQASRKPDRNWLWLVLCLLIAGSLFWMIARGCSSNKAEQPEHVAIPADTLVEDTVAQATPEVKPEPKPEPKPEKKPEVKPEPKPEVKPEPKPEKKPEVKAEDQPEPQTEVKPAAKQKVVTDVVTSQIVLTTLAEKHYGSPWFWVYIYEENRDIISNPNNIKPGTRVVIPPASKYGINPKDKASLKKAQIKSMEYLKKY